jgi:hypothetical protein
MRYDFSEKLFRDNFCIGVMHQLLPVIDSGSSCTLVGIPYVGITPFFRYLAGKTFEYFIYIDVHALSAPTKEDLLFALYKELDGTNIKSSYNEILEACKKQLLTLVQQKGKVIILINQIDYLRASFNEGLFINLRALLEVQKNKIIFIISATKPLYEYQEINLYERNLGFASKIIYFPPHNQSDLKEKTLTYPISLRPSKKDLECLYLFSGGHATLFHILLKTNYFNDPLKDSLIVSHLQSIYENYSSPQRFQLRKIAEGKRVSDLDPFLLKIGLVRETPTGYELFTPLLRDYILSLSPTRFTKKEKKLFSLFKKYKNKIISKDTLIETVWEDKASEVTDYALTSLIKRLRKHHLLKKNNYFILNERGEGYKLVKG